LAIAAAVATAWLVGAVESQDRSLAVPADFTSDPLAYYFDERYGEAIRYGDAVLGDPTTPSDVRREVRVATATIHLARGKEGLARDQFQRILADDPATELANPERLPGPVTRLFYRMRDSVCLAQLETLVANRKLVPNIRTIAIGEIDNSAPVRSRFNLEDLCRGLVHVVSEDLHGATDLKIVERQRLGTLLQELGMSKDQGLMDPQTRVRLGQLAGAQSFLWGSYMQTSRNAARINLYWVNTATGVKELQEHVQGRAATVDDIFELERKLVVNVMAPKIQRILDSTQAPGDLQRRIQKIMERRRQAMPKNSYTAWIEATGRAVAREEANDLDGAVAAWKEAVSLNPADSTASLRARTIAAFRKAGG
jgi:hypothetical protein